MAAGHCVDVRIPVTAMRSNCVQTYWEELLSYSAGKLKCVVMKEALRSYPGQLL